MTLISIVGERVSPVPYLSLFPFDFFFFFLFWSVYVLHSPFYLIRTCIFSLLFGFETLTSSLLKVYSMEIRLWTFLVGRFVMNIFSKGRFTDRSRKNYWHHFRDVHMVSRPSTQEKKDVQKKRNKYLLYVSILNGRYLVWGSRLFFRLKRWVRFLVYGLYEILPSLLSFSLYFKCFIRCREVFNLTLCILVSHLDGALKTTVRESEDRRTYPSVFDLIN